MRCHYCKRKIEQDEEYYYFDFIDYIVCDDCLYEFIDELKKEHKKIYQPDLERIDIATDEYFDEISMKAR